MPKKSLLIEIETLVKKNNDLYDELTATKRKYEESKALVATLLQRTEELQKELEARCSEVTELKVALEAVPEKDLSVVDNADEDKDLSETVELAGKTHESVDVFSGAPEVDEQIGESISADVDYGVAVELASAAIGEVVLECTELCAFFAENGGSNAKDLINLALGRTEVFKSEALCIVEESEDTANIVELLGEKKKSTLDYFDLLKKQV